MSHARRRTLYWMILCCGISILWGYSVEHAQPSFMEDFKAVYYGAKCVFLHTDPYKESGFLGVYLADGGTLPAAPDKAQIFLHAVPVCTNLPTSLLIAASFTILPCWLAQLLWLALTGGMFLLAASLISSLTEGYSCRVTLVLLCIVLANSEILFSGGNLAGIAISLCLVAVWCFLKERFIPAGIFCLAVSLALKPHDAGLVWLYFFLAGGLHRRRALQTLAVTATLALAAFLWVQPIAPDWMQELSANLMATSAHGEINAPGPSSISFRNANMLIDLQNVLSVFRDDPRFYNPASWLICGVLLLVWAIRTLRTRFTLPGALLALASVAALSMLPVYHRQYDAKLLLLTVPACAMLWAKRGLIGWIAILLSTAGILVTGDIPSAILLTFTRNLSLPASGFAGKLLIVALLQPAPFILLAMSFFYLWVYLRRDQESN
ncbi:MAG TPA: glycosyltransferase 87 family protein [Terracidiphilus sp.]